jgi:hypothetical protein
MLPSTPQLLYAPRNQPVAAGGLDAATTAWISAVNSAGGSVSGTQQTRVDTLIKALKNAANGNLFTILDRLYLFGGESDSKQATISIVNPGATAAVPTNSPTLAAGGYTGNGTTGFIDTGFIPSTAGGNFTQNSAMFGAYVRTNRTVAGSDVTLGTANASFIYIRPFNGAGNLEGGLNDNSFSSAGTSTTAQGRWVASRTGSAGFSFYKNGGAAVYSPTATSAALSSNSFYILGYNSSGSLANPTTDQVACAYFGGGMTLAQVGDFDTAIAAYMTAWGI